MRDATLLQERRVYRIVWCNRPRSPRVSKRYVSIPTGNILDQVMPRKRNGGRSISDYRRGLGGPWGGQYVCNRLYSGRVP